MSHLSAAAGAHQQRMATKAGVTERISELRALADFYKSRNKSEAENYRRQADELEAGNAKRA